MVAAALRVIVCLGGFAWQALWPVLARGGLPGAAARARLQPRRRGRSVTVHGGTPLLLLGCYHPSQQNTFTGRVTRRHGRRGSYRARACAAAGR